jgi:hypothetical protein
MASKGTAIAAGTAGIILIWSGIENRTVLDTVRSIIAGKKPSPGAPSPGSAPGPGGGGLAENIPAGKGSYSQSAVAQLWINNGGPADTAGFAAQVAIAESSGSSTVTSSNPDGGTNVGIFQLDTKGVGSGYTATELQDPNLNTQLTIMATHGGTDWSEWGDPVTAAVGYHYTPGG